MNIYDIASPFLNAYECDADYYEKYFQNHEEIFRYYFEKHCFHKEMKLEKALQQHPQKIQEMKWIAETIPSLTRKIIAQYENDFPIQFTKDVYIFVGLGGSNAYVYRSMKPHVAFCIEKLAADENALQTIIAHEFGHVTHHLLTTHAGIDPETISWSSPYTWLLQEGVATYLSMQVVKVEQDMYFAYQRDPNWLAFCENNEKRIIKAFLEDLKQKSGSEIFKEWFSINGGQSFGYKRLAYYIGYLIVAHFVAKDGLENAILLWKHSDFEERMKHALASFL